MREKIAKLTKKHGEKIRYVVVGCFNTVLDFCLYGLLANIIGVPQILSSIISTTICVSISFVLNYKFVWRSTKSLKYTIVGFLVVSLFSAWVVQSIVINLTILALGASWFTNLVAKAFGSLCGMVTNYLGYKYVFKTKNDAAK